MHNDDWINSRPMRIARWMQTHRDLMRACAWVAGWALVAFVVLLALGAR
jgi:hypothetical protein